MAKIRLRKGKGNNLPTKITAGSLYVTIDEHGLYLDIDDETRIKISDVQEFETYTDMANNLNPNLTLFYYVKDENCLYKYDGESYNQISAKTHADNIHVINASTMESFDFSPYPAGDIFIGVN